MAQRINEADRWRNEAERATKKLSKALDFFLFATAQLIKTSSLHQADEFNHCQCCKLPWPCETMTIIRGIGDKWTETEKGLEEG